MKYGLKKNKKIFLEGMRDGLPIGFGYFAVSFSLGIAAKQAGLNAFQGFLTSALVNASAGEYAGFTLIAEKASYFEMALMILITNARYLIMSCALSQRLAPQIPVKHRLLLGYNINDELFGITIAKPGFINPYYTYGAILASAPFWAVGTMFGVIAGNLLPLRIVSALSVALYGMFLAVIIPPAKYSKIIAGIIIVSFGISFVSAYLPLFSKVSSGTRTIVLTVVISAAAALLFPVQKEDTESEA